MSTKVTKALLAVIVLAGVFATAAAAADQPTAIPKLKVSITSPAVGSSVFSPVKLIGKVSGGVPPYSYVWSMRGGSPSSFTRKTSRLQSNIRVAYAPHAHTVLLRVTDSRNTRATARLRFTTVPNTSKSINSTSQNRATLPTSPVAEQPFVNQTFYRIFAANDLGMHCGDLDHRIASILPPFNVLHAQVIRTVTRPGQPFRLLTAADLNDVEVVYTAASNPKDPALQLAAGAPVYKTNFWELNPNTPLGQPANPLAFDAYNPFYPPSVLSPAALAPDLGLPSPDLAQFYPVGGGNSTLVASQQATPGVASPYGANGPQPFARFDTDFPFFVSFDFGYRLGPMNWFAADGIPMAPFDDDGRKNEFPLLRVQARSKTTVPTGTVGAILASVDTVTPVSAESDCWRCHTSSVDGGNAQAACLPAFDGAAGCTVAGSLRSPATFPVAQAADDDPSLPFEVRREWAADNNILRLHDSKNPGVTPRLQDSPPVVCQKCHYSPALDLAHVGPKGPVSLIPADTDANGREQKIHHTNSRAMHTFHSQFTDLFDNFMPIPTDPSRFDAQLGKPVINAPVLATLNNSCYQCHPGRVTKCLRGAMFNGGLVCFDCHGTMQQVGNDFSENFINNPFPGGADLNKRIPWASVPKCQSCHTGDALDNLRATPNVVLSSDGIHLLQAYRDGDNTATPIVVTDNKRFAENDANTTSVPSNVVPALYRLSKGHGGVFCEGCHGSTHAEWPVQPDNGTTIANDNMVALKAQLHSGKITECNACHVDIATVPSSGNNALDGPHGLHVVNSPRWMQGAHQSLVLPAPNCATIPSPDKCRACHGALGEGTVLSRTAAPRAGNNIFIDKGQIVTCTTCHPFNPLDPNNNAPLVNNPALCF